MAPRTSPTRKRGRPKKLRRGRRLTSTVNEWCDHTGMSRATAFRQMAAGKLRFIQDEPNAPRRIPLSEYSRHGYDAATEDDFVIIPRAAIEEKASAV
jgi:hypothetical protein